MADLTQNGLDTPTRKESNCVRCRNHGLKVTLRGHKQYCPYAACTCDKCRFTAEQQRQMRLQNAIRRAEASERPSVNVAKRARELSATPTMVTPPQQGLTSPRPQIVTVTVQGAQTQQPPTTNGISGTMSHEHSFLKFMNLVDFVDEKKMFFECSSELLKKFRYPWEMMPVMYALAKYANGNIEEVLQKIDEGWL